MIITCFTYNLFLQLVDFLQCIQLSNIKLFRLLSKIKPSFKEEGFIPDSNDPFSTDRTKTQLKRSELLLKFQTYLKSRQNLIGGDDRSRTCDPLNANQVLSQLSYIPTSLRDISNFKFEISNRSQANWLRGQDLNLRPLGYEPNELPDCSTPRHFDSGFPMLGSGTENPQSAITNPKFPWWAWVDSNYRPHAYQACALTN